MRASFSGNPSFDPWPEGVDRYVGVKIAHQSAPGETHTYYGWVRIARSITPASSALIIKDWAYNSTENAPIAAGDTGAAAEPEPSVVPRPGLLVLFSTACSGLVALRRGRQTRI